MNLPVSQAAAAKELLARRRARTSFAGFVDYVRRSYIWSDFSRTLCAELDKFVEAMEAQERPILIVGAPPQHGKLMADHTPVLTTKGWKRHGDLVAGDWVYSPSGKAVQVLAVSDKAPADWRVDLGNGESFYCHGKHEWTVHSRDKKRELTLETEQIAAMPLTSGEMGKRGGRYKVQLPLVEALDGPDIDLPLHPYALGVWLGDGTQAKPYISYEECDGAVVERLEELGHSIKKTYVHKTTGVLSSVIPSLQQPLLDMGLMARKYGVRLKTIPDQYLAASKEQRLQLLAGLVDTDGYCYQKNGRVVFTTADEQLADAFCALIATFGIGFSKVTEKPKLSSSGIQGVSDYYVVGFTPTFEVPCILDRKRSKPTKTRRRVSVVAVTHDPQGYQGHCIQVDASDGLYLVGHTMQPTHNSELISRLFPAYVLGRDTAAKVGGLSYSADLATRMNLDVQRIMMGAAYAKVFPETRLNEGRVATGDDTAKRNSYGFDVVGKDGGYVCAGVGGPLTGQTLTLGIIDDPIKNSKEALSKTVKSSIWDWYTSTFTTRLSKSSGQIIMATRWALDDLSGLVAEKYPRAKVLTFKAIDDQGQALVPDLHPIEKLLETKSVLSSYFWAAMYQQDPIPDGGGDFKPQNIQLVDAMPAGLRYVRGWDLAATMNKTSDYTASTKMGIDANGVLWVEVQRFRAGPDDVDNAILQAAELDGRSTMQSLPQDPGQAGVAQKVHFGKLLKGHAFTCSAESGDKRSRAMPFASQVNVGNVRLVNNQHAKDYLDELESFPAGAHDDMVDSSSRAYNDLLSKSGYNLNNL